jgi:hypothetical protein
LLALYENERYNTTSQGITRFSDWTKEERAKLLMKSRKPRLNTQMWEKPPKNLPERFDWRDNQAVTDVIDQG